MGCSHKIKTKTVCENIMRNRAHGGDKIHNRLSRFSPFWKFWSFPRIKQHFFKCRYLKNGSFRKITCNFYYILGRECPTSKSNYDYDLWLTLLWVVRISKFEILNRSTQKVTNNYQSVIIFITVCDRRSRGRVFIPYCIPVVLLTDRINGTGILLLHLK